MNFTEWKAEAMRLADNLTDAATDYGRESELIHSLDSWASADKTEVQAARAALEAHLEELPMGAAVAYEVPPERKFYTGLVPKTRAIISAPDFGGDDARMHESAKSGGWSPLYLHPKESA